MLDPQRLFRVGGSRHPSVLFEFAQLHRQRLLGDARERPAQRGLTWLVLTLLPIGLGGIAPFGAWLASATGGFFSSAAGPGAFFSFPCYLARRTKPLPANSPGFEVAAIAGRP